MTNVNSHVLTAEKIGRERVAKVAEAHGEIQFAREVRAGCWDHSNDVSGCIEEAFGGKPIKLKGE